MGCQFASLGSVLSAWSAGAFPCCFGAAASEPGMRVSKRDVRLGELVEGESLTDVFEYGELVMDHSHMILLLLVCDKSLCELGRNSKYR